MHSIILLRRSARIISKTGGSVEEKHLSRFSRFRFETPRAQRDMRRYARARRAAAHKRPTAHTVQHIDKRSEAQRI